jgi:formylglycine-generating enzyme required for sulfatase activity
MHGNVWEWCLDSYGDYPSGAVTDPTEADRGSLRVFRGRGWLNLAEYCRSTNRYYCVESLRINDLGFRLALVPIEIP